jgi:hypothetical protein
MTISTNCRVCGEPVDLDIAHNPHELDCAAAKQLRAVCTCDQWVHPTCCWECRRRSLEGS